MNQQIHIRHLRRMRKVKQIVDGKTVYKQEPTSNGGLTIAYTITPQDENHSVIEYSWAKCHTRNTFCRTDGAKWAVARFQKHHITDRNLSTVVENEDIRAGFIVSTLVDLIEEEIGNVIDTMHASDKIRNAEQYYKFQGLFDHLMCTMAFIKKNYTPPVVKAAKSLPETAMA